MTHHCTIYGLGTFRAATWNGESAIDAIGKALASFDRTKAPADYVKLQSWAESLLTGAAQGYSAMQCEHGGLGMSWASRPHDPWLDSVLQRYERHPAIDYRAAVSERAPAI